jgi:hypothetical protein
MTPQERNNLIDECLRVIRPPDENCNCGQCRASRSNREAVAALKAADWDIPSAANVRVNPEGHGIGPL